MARFSGPQFAGANRAHRAVLRAAAMERQTQAELARERAAAGLKRRRNRLRLRECS